MRGRRIHCESAFWRNKRPWAVKNINNTYIISWFQYWVIPDLYQLLSGGSKRSISKTFSPPTPASLLGLVHSPPTRRKLFVEKAKRHENWSRKPQKLHAISINSHSSVNNMHLKPYVILYDAGGASDTLFPRLSPLIGCIVGTAWLSHAQHVHTHTHTARIIECKWTLVLNPVPICYTHQRRFHTAKFDWSGFFFYFSCCNCVTLVL